MSLTLAQLQLFRDIAHLRSVSKGAAANSLSQSAASQQLQELESEAGLPLLDRSTRPLAVTDAGRLYLEMCRDVLRRRDDCYSALEEMKSNVEGLVRVASIYSVGLTEFGQLEGEFLRRYPNARLHVDYLRPEKVYEAILADRADIGLVSYPEPARDITVRPWREEEMVVAASPYHPLAQRSEVSAADLDGLDFVAFDDDLPIRQHIDRYLRERHVQVRQTAHFDNLQMIKEAVAHGLGVSIVPARILANEVAQGRLVPIPIADPELFRPVGIIHRRKKRFARAAEAFLELLQQEPPVAASELTAVYAS